MKTLILTCSLLLSFLPAFSQSGEQEAVKKAIIQETRAFWNCDYEAWSNAMLNADYISFAVTPPHTPTGLQYMKGTELYQNNAKMLQSGDCKPFQGQVAQSDWNIQIRGNVAWASYKETVTMPDDNVVEIRTLKVVEKQRGQWMVAAISSIGDFHNASKPWNPKNVRE